MTNLGTAFGGAEAIAGVDSRGLATGGEGVGSLLSRFKGENLARFHRVVEDLS